MPQTLEKNKNAKKRKFKSVEDKIWYLRSKINQKTGETRLQTDQEFQQTNIKKLKSIMLKCIIQNWGEEKLLLLNEKLVNLRSYSSEVTHWLKETDITHYPDDVRILPTNNTVNISNYSGEILKHTPAKALDTIKETLLYDKSCFNCK